MIKPICGKWAELAIEDDYYIPFTANRKAILSFFLCSQEIDLEKLPYNFFQPFHYFKSLKGEKYDTKVEKVYLCDIVGTSYLDYSNDNGIIYSFLHLKRAERYILSGDTKRTKYFYHLKRINDNMIQLSQASDGKYYVDGNGNHRVIMYKMMMLSEIAKEYPYVYEEDYDLDFCGFTDITHKYWLYAEVKHSKESGIE